MTVNFTELKILCHTPWIYLKNFLSGMLWSLSWLLTVCCFCSRRSSSPTIVWQKWRICQPILPLVNWIWTVSLLTDIYIYWSASAHTQAHASLFSFFSLIMPMKVYLTHTLCLPVYLVYYSYLCLRQRFQRDQWSWAVLQANPSQPGTQQDPTDQWPGQSASHTPLPRRYFCITVWSMMNRYTFTSIQ